MKKALLTGSLMLAGISLFAQLKHASHFTNGKLTTIQQLSQSLLNKQTASLGTAQKPTGMQQRVIAQTSIDGDLSVEDSLTYRYSGTRTSRYNHNSFVDEPTYNTGFSSDFFTGAIGDLISKSADLQADSIISYDGSTPIGISRAFYRSDNKIDSFFSYYNGGTTLYSRNATRHIFNNTGGLQQFTNLSNFNNATILDTTEYKKFWYNTAGTQLVKDTTYNFSGTNMGPAYATLYFYNAQNNLDSLVELNEEGGTFYASTCNKIKYDASGRILEVLGVFYDNTGAINETSIFKFAYTGTSPLYTLFEQSYIQGGDTSTSAVIKTLGSNNLPDTVKYGFYENGAFELDMAYKYFYNTYNNPDAAVGYDIDGVFAHRYNFYYETYDDGNNVGVKNPEVNKNFNIYPNPFNNKINIDWKNAATQAKISLVNMVGQTIYTSNKSLSAGNNVIDLPVTVNGNYILMIQDEKGNIYNQKLSKR